MEDDEESNYTSGNRSARSPKSPKSPEDLQSTMQSLQRQTINPEFVKELKVLSPIKAAKLESVKRFIRHASATIVLMASSSQILYAYICGMRIVLIHGE